jgi:hypothetical protein
MKQHHRAIYWTLIFGLFYLFFLPGVLCAQSADKVYSLEESIEEALSNNWNIEPKSERISG